LLWFAGAVLVGLGLDGEVNKSVSKKEDSVQHRHELKEIPKRRTMNKEKRMPLIQQQNSRLHEMKEERSDKNGQKRRRPRGDGAATNHFLVWSQKTEVVA